MKKRFVFCFGLLFSCCIAYSQTVGRATFSSGGSSTNFQLPSSVGEIFNVQRCDPMGSINMGSQQSTIHNGSCITISSSEPPNIFEIVLAPNPSSSQIHLSLKNFPIIDGFFFVVAPDGSIVIRQSFNSTEFDLPIDLIASGIYRLAIFNSQGALLKSLPFIKI